MKVLTVVGNRPQFVKAAPLSVALRDAGLAEVVVPVLPRVDDHLGEPGVAEGNGERRRLDELRSVADDGQDLHAIGC